jgi:hypothetical protein
MEGWKYFKHNERAAAGAMASAVVVQEKRDTDEKDGQMKVWFFPYGGGFVYKMPVDEFDAMHTEVSQEEFHKLLSVYRPGEFYGDWFAMDEDALALPNMPGYTNDQHWNGWAMPLFEKPVIDEALQDDRLGGEGLNKITYVEDKDAYVIIDTYGERLSDAVDRDAVIKAAFDSGKSYLETKVSEHGFEGYVEIVTPEFILVGNELRKVYNIGGGSWCWNEDEKEEEAVA